MVPRSIRNSSANRRTVGTQIRNRTRCFHKRTHGSCLTKFFPVPDRDGRVSMCSHDWRLTHLIIGLIPIRDTIIFCPVERYASSITFASNHEFLYVYSPALVDGLRKERNAYSPERSRYFRIDKAIH